ncbi:hypothetical protein RUM43_007313 [Polyplax serrata]|uniref:Uncharacterized protein n=1 Tax=Polyplax serrata TaxID=468196 RepID=A0AAN8Q5W5_POLSC
MVDDCVGTICDETGIKLSEEEGEERETKAGAMVARALVARATVPMGRRAERVRKKQKDS